MRIDSVGLLDNYSKLPTEELRRLVEEGGLTPEAQSVLEQELARRGDDIALTIADTVYEFAAQEMAGGLRGLDLERKLVAEGVQPAAATVIVRELAEAETHARRQAARNSIARGALSFVVGVVLTVFTYNTAKKTGFYFVAWGAMLYGTIEILRGWARSRAQ